MRHDDFRRGRCARAAQQRVADELDDFIRAVAEDEGRRLHPELGREFLFQIKRVAIGIQMDAGEGGLQRRQRARRRSEGIFVRCHLADGVGRQPEFARDFLNRPAGLISRQGWEKRI